MAWTDTLEAVAPGLATALGGPVAGLAVTTIEKVLGLTPGTGTPDTMAAAFNNATPDQLLALKKADNDFQVQMKQLDINLEDIAEKDRDSARQRQSATKDPIPGILALVAVAGFFGILVYMLVYGLQKDVAGSDAFLLLLGSLGTVVTQVFAFYYGSSKGSQGKDETIKLLSK